MSQLRGGPMASARLHVPRVRPAPPSAAAAAPPPARRLSLRVTLQAVLLGILLATVVGLTLVAYWSQAETVDVLETQLLSTTTEMLSDRMTDQIDIIPRVL